MPALRANHHASGMTLGAQTQRLQLPSPPAGHPTASNCFAWEVDGQVTAVFVGGRSGPAQDAVRASRKACSGT